MIMAVIAVMIYRVSVSSVLFPIARNISLSYSQVKLMVSLSAATMNLLVIVILNKVSREREHFFRLLMGV